MDRDETWALYQQGRAAWNAWADDMLAKRKALEDAYMFVGEERVTWETEAIADFRERTFESDADFRHMRFPGLTWLINAMFSGAAQFDHAAFFHAALFRTTRFSGNAHFSTAHFSGEAQFGGANFSGVAWFNRAKFSSDARFHGANFSGLAWFEAARFSGSTDFQRVQFSGSTYLQRARFSGDARFDSTHFSSDARFDDTHFSGDASFDAAQFSGDARFDAAQFSGDARFEGVHFRKLAWFDGAWFADQANFRGLYGGIAFSLARAQFARLPDFIQANFLQAPRLDDIGLGPQGLWIPTFAQVKAPFQTNGKWFDTRTFNILAQHATNELLGPVDPDRPAKWRALERLAVEGHDYQRALRFFAGEVKANRWTEDEPWHPRFWFGFLYQVFSNFGQSLWRPLVWWAAVIAFCFGLYLSEHLATMPVPPLRQAVTAPMCQGEVLGCAETYLAEVNPRVTGFAWAWRRLVDDAPALSCRVGDSTPLRAALQLSIRKGLLLPGLGSDERVKQLHACLYGIHHPSPATSRALPPRYTPRIPDAVHALELVQTVVSAVLIFLFLLAVRNHFRIK